MKSSITDILSELKDKMTSLSISAEKGLGKDLFLFVSSLTPIVNVDLLVYNEKNQFLLSKRNDPHCGIGWSVPGGCVRFKETTDTRIKLIAQQELDLPDVNYEKNPIKVFEILSSEKRNIANQDERAHFITLVYKCYAPSSYIINNKGKTDSEEGSLKWFDKLPDYFLRIQNCYKEILK